jgi:putative ABC transport system permease protein
MRSILDTIALALSTLRANPLRSGLTLLGIVIGASTVVAMMALTEGLRIRANNDLALLGTTSFQVNKFPVGFGDIDWEKYARRHNLTREQGEALSGLPHVAHVSIEATRDNKPERIWTSTRSTQPSIRIVGGTPGYEKVNNVALASGRFFSDIDVALGRRVIVIGAEVADLLFPGQDPVGQMVRVRQAPFTVIGVADRMGTILGLESRDSFAVVPIDAYYAVLGRVTNHEFGVAATGSGDVQKAQDEVIQLLRRLRGIRGLAENDFEIFTNDSLASTINQLAGAVSVATFGVCVLALLVGGIGIMNIMLVSVTERTREIGIRMALGARRRRILAQFVVEASALSSVGGVLGVLVGAGIAVAARELYQIPASIPLWAVLLSLAAASGCGLLFGIYPAARASRLDPVEAMRTE